MNPRVEKYKAEHAKNSEKIQSLQARNRELEDKIRKLENTDIIGMVREIGMTPDQLAEFLALTKTISPHHAANTIEREESDANENE
jgi:hypothetical protein